MAEIAGQGTDLTKLNIYYLNKNGDLELAKARNPGGCFIK